jgi:hypothetical protein
MSKFKLLLALISVGLILIVGCDSTPTGIDNLDRLDPLSAEMVECPECHGMVPIEFAKCPHCGAWMPEDGDHESEGGD